MIQTLQLYGLDSKPLEIKSLLNRFNISSVECCLFDLNDLSFIEEIVEYDIPISGVHCSILAWESLDQKSQQLLLDLSGGRIIIPAAVEENSLRWPLSFFRRTPVLYQWLKRRIDGQKKRSFRKVLVGKGFSSLNYFQSRFWKQFSEEVNKLQSQWAMVGLHNHGFEFESLEDGNVPFDILIKNAGDSVFFQFDITNCLLAGYDPAQIISKNISSISSYHVRIEGEACEQYYENLFSKYDHFFVNREIVVELTEKEKADINHRLAWWTEKIKFSIS